MVSASFADLGRIFQNFGVMDFLLPFLLVFTIVYAVLQRTKILGDPQHERKNFNVIVALVLALVFVVPHIMGSYPLGYDPVQVMNESLPSISLVAVAAVMLLILMGIFGANFSATAAPFIAILSILFVVYIFGASLNLWRAPYDIFSWWSTDTTEMVIIILVFGVIVWFITSEPNSKTPGGDLVKGIGKLFERK